MAVRLRISVHSCARRSGAEMGNYTKSPNEIYAAMPDMSEAELRVTMALVRLTYGYHREDCKATFDTLQEMTGMSRQGVADGAKAVKERGFFRPGEKRSMWETVCSVDQNSLPSRPNDEPEQSTTLTNSVYLVDQNSLPSRPSTSGLKKNIKKSIKKEEQPQPPAPEPDGELLQLEKHFINVAGIIPGRSGYDENWERPLALILDQAGSIEKAKERIAGAVEFARNGSGKRYTISSPRSLTAIIANMPDAYDSGPVKVRTR